MFIPKITDTKQIKDLLSREKSIRRFGLVTYMLPIEGATGRTVQVEGKELIMLGSYSYLDLITHPEVIKVAHETLDKYGVGAGGVRLLTGTTDLHKELERKIADFKRTDDANKILSDDVSTREGVRCPNEITYYDDDNLLQFLRIPIMSTK